MLNQIEMVNQFLCIALGGNAFLHPYIDDLYSKNEWEYYEAYKKSNLNGNPLFSMYTTKSEEKIRQVAGIMEWCYQNNQLAVLDQLIKKGYKFVYQYLQHHSEIDFEHFMRSFAKRQKRKMVKEIELIYQNTVLWYLSERESKPINKWNIAWNSFQEVLYTSINEVDVQKELFSKNMVDQNREEIDQLYEEYQIPNINAFDSLGRLLEYLIGVNLKRTVENFPADQAEELVFQHSPVKFIGALGGWLKTLNIHEMDATEKVSFSKEDLDMIFLQILYAKKHNHIQKEEQDLFFIACLYLKCLSTHFFDAKQLYLDQSKQDYYVDMKAKEAKVKEQEKELLNLQRSWQLTNSSQLNEIEGLKKELWEAQARIRQLEAKVDEIEDYSKEVHALRNLVYTEEHEDDSFDKAPPLQSMIAFIQTKRIVVFGGFPNWRQKLKEQLEHVDFIDPEELNRDISIVQRADAVLINTSVFGHAFYKKIMKELKKCETPLFYLRGQSNIEKNILEIYQKLK